MFVAGECSEEVELGGAVNDSLGYRVPLWAISFPVLLVLGMAGFLPMILLARRRGETILSSPPERAGFAVGGVQLTTV